MGHAYRKHEREYGQHLEAEPTLAATTKEKEPQSYNLWELNLASNWNELGTNFFSRTLSKECSLTGL